MALGENVGECVRSPVTLNASLSPCLPRGAVLQRLPCPWRKCWRGHHIWANVLVLLSTDGIFLSKEDQHKMIFLWVSWCFFLDTTFWQLLKEKNTVALIIHLLFMSLFTVLGNGCKLASFFLLKIKCMKGFKNIYISHWFNPFHKKKKKKQN